MRKLYISAMSMFIMTFGMTFGAVETAQAAKECGAKVLNNNSRWGYVGYFGCIGRDKKCGSFESWAQKEGAKWVNARVTGNDKQKLRVYRYESDEAENYCKKAGFGKPRKRPFVCYTQTNMRTNEKLFKAQELGGTCMK